MRKNVINKAHPSLRKTELVFIAIALFMIAFTLGLYLRKPTEGAALKRESIAPTTSSTAVVTSPAASPLRSPLGGYINKININTALAEELTTLPEIGEVLAGRIVEYRKTNGVFKKAEDIMKVSGIGAKTFEKIKDLISVGE